eukprot:CAMPEP_0195127204 /NCGR_PEP_ID=MMETSP0448-20130528/136533_1 /TAXON_ID=66468 /ORGANISM="Heterocapsa triquestra, Strain CCMP 448" /LENGTH=149 /DNA_ID=CAMNT_0040164927 /DNA_START=51 /DNA_END=497 /DNA_ORIENTATION=-
MKPRCTSCSSGKFSLGGGMLVSGVAGDWRRPWPVELQTSCMYKGTDDMWHMGDSGGSSCRMKVVSPIGVAGNYSIKTQAWNNRLSVPAPFMGDLQLAPGDGTACQKLQPPKQTLGRARTIIMVVRDGGCSSTTKAVNAAAANAHAVLLL